jgi:hypothetical protein
VAGGVYVVYDVYVTETRKGQVKTPERDPRVVVSTRVSIEGRDAIDAIAAAEQRNRSDMVRILLSEAVAARQRGSGARR